MATDNKPLNEDQILELWRQSGGHTIRFARLLESFHGIKAPDCGGAQHARRS